MIFSAESFNDFLVSTQKELAVIVIYMFFSYLPTLVSILLLLSAN